jgi:hypothetical protein
VQSCPFCGSPETDRLDLDGQRVLVFRCMFSPVVDPGLSEPELAAFLRGSFGTGEGRAYFRSMCDRLHLFVVKGDGRTPVVPPSEARPMHEGREGPA